MKKNRNRREQLLSIVLAVVLLCSTLPVTAFAAGNEELTEGSSALIHVNPLYADVINPEDLASSAAQSEDEPACLQSGETVDYCGTVAEAGAVLREGMTQRQAVITVGLQASEYSDDFVYDILDAALEHTGTADEGDYLLWQYAGSEISLTYDVRDEVYLITYYYSMTYYTTAEQESYVEETINTILSQLDLDEASDYEKIKAIYDYITGNVAYDYTNLENEDYKLKYTAYAALHDGTAVCQGYSLLLYRMALTVGLDCRIISGIANGGAHAWNIVCLDGKYYNLDATWDAGLTDYAYFLKADFTDHVRAADYTSTEFADSYPMADSDYVAETTDDTDDESGTQLTAPVGAVWNDDFSGFWTITETADCSTGIGLYDSDGNAVDYKTWLGKKNSYDFSEAIMESGTYYYEVQMLPKDENHTASEKLRSPEITYTRPDTILGTTVLVWDTEKEKNGSFEAVENAKEYEIEIEMKKFGGSSWTQIYDIWTPNLINDFEEFFSGDGDYRVRIRAISSDITQFANGDWGEYSEICRVGEPIVENIFSDVTAGVWYTKAVQYMFDNGYMTGKSEILFGTGEALTREQFVTILYSIAGKPEVTYTAQFSDVPEEQWYTNAVLWAYQQGITSGYANGNFGVSDSITREQLALMLYQYAQKNGYATECTDTILDSYTDKTAVSSWAATGLKWAVTQGVVTGKCSGSDLTVAPQDTASRAECAQMMYKLLTSK